MFICQSNYVFAHPGNGTWKYNGEHERYGMCLDLQESCKLGELNAEGIDNRTPIYKH